MIQHTWLTHSAKTKKLLFLLKTQFQTAFIQFPVLILILCYYKSSISIRTGKKYKSLSPKVLD